MARRRSKRLRKLLRAANRRGIMPSLISKSKAITKDKAPNRGQSGFMEGCHQASSDIRWCTYK